MKNIQLIIRKIDNKWSYNIDLKDGRKPKAHEILEIIEALISLPTQSSPTVERGD